MRTLKIDEDTLELAESIINDIKASEDLGLLKCIQCGMCTSVCPAARHSDYDSRVIVKRVLDQDETLISDDIIWDCFTCYSCHSVCPVNNSVSEVIQILRQKSIENKTGISKVASFTTYGDSFLELGIGSIPDEFFNDMIKDIGKEYLELKINLDGIREELELGSIILPDKDLKDIKNILKRTGFIDRLNKIKAVNNDEEDTR